jgi:hypothetical protein
MDKRCIRKLNDVPKEFCPAAIARLRWRESFSYDYNREPTEQDEASAPGCVWAIRSQEDMFCFFKALAEPREPYNDAQIAHALGLKETTVKKVREQALAKLTNYKEFREMKTLYGQEAIVTARLVNPYESQLDDISDVTLSEDPPVTEE